MSPTMRGDERRERVGSRALRPEASAATSESMKPSAGDLVAGAEEWPGVAGATAPSLVAGQIRCGT
jgi:hypothetical protein